MNMFSDFIDLKIYICNHNYVRIENYQRLIEISSNIIYIDKVQIKGNNLIIQELNDIEMTIEGEINEITFV